MSLLLRIPKRQVRVAAVASVVVALGAGVGIAAQSDPDLLGGGSSAQQVLIVPALPHARTLEFDQHPEERLQGLPPQSEQGSPPQGEQGPPPQGEQGEQAEGQQGEASQEQVPPVAQGASPPLLTPAERAALALVDQIIGEQEGVLMGSGFDYIPGDRRDPFASLLVQIGAVTAPGLRPPGLAGFLVSEVDLKGIATANGRWHAMIIGTNQRAYFIEVGTQLYDGHVVDIRAGEVLFEQVVSDALGVRRIREVTKRLRTTDGGGETP